MAAGLSKTKWNGNGNGSHHPKVISPSNLNVSLSYEGKQDEKFILEGNPADLQILWQDENSSNKLFGS